MAARSLQPSSEPEAARSDWKRARSQAQSLPSASDCVMGRFDRPALATDCHTTVPGTLLVRLEAMAVPLDEGARDRRRVGPFWIEEGPAALITGAAIVVIFAALFILAVAMRPA